MSSKKYMDVLSKLFKSYQNADNFMKCAQKVRVLTAEEGKVRVEFEVTKDLTNPHGTLHGGCTATLIDIATTGACIVTERGQPGVSVDLHVSYLAAAKLGETVVMDSEVIRIGKSTAFTRADLYIKDTNKIIATGLHTKAFPPELKKYE